jgi:hypothetical protein
VACCLAPVFSVYCHDHRKEDEQAKNTHEEPAHIILELHFALFGFRLSLHYFFPLPKNPADDEENDRQRTKDNKLKFVFHDELPPLCDKLGGQALFVEPVIGVLLVPEDEHEDRYPPCQEQHKTAHGEEGKKSTPEPFSFLCYFFVHDNLQVPNDG